MEMGKITERATEITGKHAYTYKKLQRYRLIIYINSLSLSPEQKVPQSFAESRSKWILPSSFTVKLL